MSLIYNMFTIFRSQISHFTEEMAALRESVKKMQSNCRLTDNTDLRTLKKTTDDLGKLLAKIRDTTKV